MQNEELKMLIYDSSLALKDAIGLRDRYDPTCLAAHQVVATCTTNVLLCQLIMKVSD